MIFILVQITHSCPSMNREIGVQHALSDYIMSLPPELLPTFWNDAERDLLSGTSLAEALDAKMSSLYREFDYLREATSSISWCQKYWWDDQDGLLEFDDWRQIDAMYRSRALEFPGVGDAMVPCIDIANHASGSNTVARYEVDSEGQALLLLLEGKSLKEGSEVTITYGDGKGACEMIFSYGFLENDMSNARAVFLSLTTARIFRRTNSET